MYFLLIYCYVSIAYLVTISLYLAACKLYFMLLSVSCFHVYFDRLFVAIILAISSRMHMLLKKIKLTSYKSISEVQVYDKMYDELVLIQSILNRDTNFQ